MLSVVIVVVIVGEEHQKQKAHRKQMFELVLGCQRQKGGQGQMWQERADQTKVDRTPNLQLGRFGLQG